MNGDDAKSLCLKLMLADSEDEVVDLLKEANYWSDQRVWRNYGDYENNYNTIGNQQSRPDAALVEKCINSVDARLMCECLARGINPEGSNAPQSIRQAVATCFDERVDPGSSLAGRVVNWTDEKRTSVAKGITIAATGMPPRQGKPCFTISDCGEGQTPQMMPATLLSLNKSNKLRIPFVQGKFNMGGSGVLKFCGRKGLQLIVSRRQPSILGGQLTHPSDDQWGFTIVRREDPAEGRRSSVYTYLAPVGACEHPREGSVLSFPAHSMPIFPEGRNAYGRNATGGTLIKLYEYAAAGYSNTHILRKDGLLSRIDLLLPDPALPMRLYECRDSYGGHEGSFETTLTGIAVRLEDGKAENLESGFPSSCPISVEGEQMMATIYAFKKGKADTYRRNEGIIFTVNGQTHGHLTRDFFNRKAAGRLNYISDSILVSVDCNEISGRRREDLFMNSRDRLSHNEIRYLVEDKLEEMLKQHQGLRDLKERRRNEEVQSKLEDEKPLEEILKSLLQHSPTLSALFLQGQRATNPFKTLQVQQHEKTFEGKRHPCYFKFKDREYGEVLHRECHINQRSRIVFETDAVNDYFSRTVDRGDFSLFLVRGEARSKVSDYVGPNLQNGVATLTIQLPADATVGTLLKLEACVNDETMVEPFVNTFELDVKEAIQPTGGKPGPRRKPPDEQAGNAREIAAGISLPNIIPIHEQEWASQNPPFDKYTALRIGITDLPSSNGDEQNEDTHDVYDFKINMDNIFLKTELKAATTEIEITSSQWKYGLVLAGLALLHDDAQSKKTRGSEGEHSEDEDNGDDIETRVEHFTRALAPVLLPMINSLGALEAETVIADLQAGEST